MNKFEQISSDDQQMSHAGGRVCPEESGMSRGVGCPGDTSYHETYPMMHVMLPIPPRHIPVKT